MQHATYTDVVTRSTCATADPVRGSAPNLTCELGAPAEVRVFPDVCPILPSCSHRARWVCTYPRVSRAQTPCARVDSVAGRQASSPRRSARFGWRRDQVDRSARGEPGPSWRQPIGRRDCCADRPCPPEPYLAAGAVLPRRQRRRELLTVWSPSAAVSAVAVPTPGIFSSCWLTSLCHRPARRSSANSDRRPASPNEPQQAADRRPG